MLFADMIVPPDQGGPPMLFAQAASLTVDREFTDSRNVQDVANFDPAFGEAGQGRIFGPEDIVVTTLMGSRQLKIQVITNEYLNNIGVVIETLPKHGQIERIESGEFAGSFRYTPDADFLGQDFASFIVTIEDKKFRVKMYLNVISHTVPYPEGEEENWGEGEEEGCENGAAVHDRKFAVVITNDGELWLVPGMSGFLKTADLPGTAVAQTTGSQITLDDNAAGYGWYIDYTPYLNEEWWPISSQGIAWG